MRQLLNAWDWMSGKKALLGTLLAVIYAGALSQGLIERNLQVEFFITSVLGVGLGHRIIKTS